MGKFGSKKWGRHMVGKTREKKISKTARCRRMKKVIRDKSNMIHNESVGSVILSSHDVVNFNDHSGME